MTRGDLITVVVSGDHGKPRPAIVIQSDAVPSATVLVCLLTSDVVQVAPSRASIQPTPTNGLRKPSLIQIENIYPSPRSKCGPVFGRLGAEEQAELNLLLNFVLGLGD